MKNLVDHFATSETIRATNGNDSTEIDELRNTVSNV